ncbi:DUF3859 domain-containing protein [Flammeovirga sp. SJP92]|uniref:DUF3859 domain-containing protein n=1 Tax=Flammeovirga sp. SJP92 TaxID=1775430 RepID=UPI000787CAB8|nr:DUF3859 domain-containing protein [Flammeovirga sp. SJP92]KXX72393.1 hypothetical protein AVL50_01980 [Flammeovirga sp. SJP92]
MGEYTKNQVIYLQKDNVASIKNALQKYQVVLNNRTAISNKGFHMEMDVKFMEDSGDEPRNLKTSDIKDFETFKKAFAVRSPSFDQMKQEDSYRDDFEASLLSEPLLFSLALEHEELKEEVIKTAKGIAEISRHYNNSESMWTYNSSAYGAVALYILTCNDINYAYILAQYLIPYWDERYTCDYDCYLFELVKQHGWIRPLIKAYLYCDNPNFRAGMMRIGYYHGNLPQDENPTLFHFLKENPEEYAWFKESIKERLLDEPMLYYKGEDDSENPVLSLYYTLNGSVDAIHDEEDEFISEFFISDTIENEATDLYNSILNSTDQPLMRLDGEGELEKEARQYTDKDTYTPGEGIMDFRAFVMALEYGAQIWQYVENGENAELINSLDKVDVMGLALESSPALYHKISYHLPGVDLDDDCNPMNKNKGLVDEMDHCLREIIDDLTLFNDESLYADDIPQAFNPLPEHRGEVRYQQLIRVLDVFYVLLGKPTFVDDVCERIIEDKEEYCLSTAEFYDRYSEENYAENGKLPPLLVKQMASIVEEFSTPYDRDSIDTDLLKKLDYCLSTSRGCYNTDHLGKHNAGDIALASYMLKMDEQNGIEDQYTLQLKEYLQAFQWEKVASIFTERDRFSDLISEDTKEKINNYITAIDTPLLSQEEMMALLNDTLVPYEEEYNGARVHHFSKTQRSYYILRFDDNISKVLIFSFWAQTLSYSKDDPRAKRFWNLMLALSPFWVLNKILKTASSSYGDLEFESPQKEKAFFQSLSEVGVPDSLLFAFEIVKSQNSYGKGTVKDLKRYLPWINTFKLVQQMDKNDAMFDMLHYRVEQLKEGLKSADDINVVQFHRDLSASDEGYNFDKETESLFHDYLHVFFTLNWKDDSKEGIADMVAKMIDYIEGNLDYDTFAPLFWSKIKGKRFHTYVDSYKSYSFEQFFWGLRESKQDRLIKLLSNGTSASFSILFNGLERGYKEKLVREGQLKFKDIIDLDFKDDEIKEQAHAYYINRVFSLGADKIRLIKYCIDQEEKAYGNYLGKLGRRGELDDVVSELNKSRKNSLIDHFKDQSGAEQLIGLFKDDSSRKIKDKARHILQKLKVQEPVEEECENLYDFGVYDYCASEINLQNQTDKIVAIIGTTFGLRFVVGKNDDRDIINHTVYVQHPIIKDGAKTSERSEWTQQGKNGQAIFAGWTFETADELISGEYSFKIYDWRRNLIAEKSFLIESEVLTQLKQVHNEEEQSDGYYTFCSPKTEGIVIEEGEQLLRNNQPIVPNKAVEFDGYGVSESDLNNIIICDYVLVSEKVAKAIGKHHPFGCFFIPALINTSDGKSIPYYLIKPTIYFGSEETEVHQNTLIFTIENQTSNLIFKKVIRDELQEIIGSEILEKLEVVTSN